MNPYGRCWAATRAWWARASASEGTGGTVERLAESDGTRVRVGDPRPVAGRVEAMSWAQAVGHDPSSETHSADQCLGRTPDDAGCVGQGPDLSEMMRVARLVRSDLASPASLPIPKQVDRLSRPTKQEWALGIAQAAGARGDCRRSRVGAALVRADGSVCAVGYNGTDAGSAGCLDGACPRGLLSYAEVAAESSYDTGPGMCIARHAEINTCAAAREDTTGMTLYVTRSPCLGCWKMLGAFRLAAVVWPGGERAM